MGTAWRYVWLARGTVKYYYMIYSHRSQTRQVLLHFTSLYQFDSMSARAKAWFTVWNHLGSPFRGWHHQRSTCFLRHKSSMITVMKMQEKYWKVLKSANVCKCLDSYSLCVGSYIKLLEYFLSAEISWAPLGGCSEALCILKSVTTPMKICGVGLFFGCGSTSATEHELVTLW